jgi:hypothetical protein
MIDHLAGRFIATDDCLKRIEFRALSLGIGMRRKKTEPIGRHGRALTTAVLYDC